MKKTYLFLADGFEEIEALTVVDLLRRADIEIAMVSLMEQLEVTGSHGIKVIADELFQEENYADCQCLILPGGADGTDRMKKHKKLGEILCAHMKENKLVGAICAAPTVLAELDLLIGRCVTCYPGLERRLYDAAPVSSEVVTEGNLITSKSAGTAIPFALSLIEAIKGQEEAERVSKEIVFMGLPSAF